MQDALLKRHSCYNLTPQLPVPNAKVEEIVGFALQKVPSAFNSQTTRLILLWGEQYQRFWKVVLETLRGIVPPANFAGTEAKITSFAAGCGTILFYENLEIVEKLQADYPLYRDNFPIWSQHTSAMHQLTIWTLLAEAGVGASLQHYNPIIDAEVAKTWSIPTKWKLVAEMPFGGMGDVAEQKEKTPLNETLKIYK